MTASIFELTSQRQKLSRLPTEPPGRPACLDKYKVTMSLLQGCYTPGCRFWGSFSGYLARVHRSIHSTLLTLFVNDWGDEVIDIFILNILWRSSLTLCFKERSSK